MLQRFHKNHCCAGPALPPYIARSKGRAALTLGRAIELDLADE
jgi:hypothetical protein